MLRIALKMLMGDRAKYLTLVCGLSFVALLFVQQGATFLSLITRSARPIEAIGAPIWVTDPMLRNFDEEKPLLDTDLTRVRSVPGVKWAVPLFVRNVQARLHSGNFQTVRLFGLDSSTLVGRPGKMLEGDSALLTQEYGVVASRANLDKLDNAKLGDTFEMNDNQARIVGIAEVWPDLQSSPYVFTTYDRALNYAPPQRKELSFVLAAPADGVSLDQAMANIRQTTGLATYSEDQFRALTVDYVLKNTGIPIGFGLSLMLAFLVGMAITGQTFLQFALQNERYFGALKAMGTSNLTLTKMTLLQSVIVAFVGFGIGGGLAAVIGLIAGPGGALPFFAPWQLMAISFGVVVTICVLSSLLSVRKILKLEPAVVFKS